MGFWSRLFSLGRVKQPPKGHDAGRFLPPASVLRSHLGVRQLGLADGVVTMSGGELRAVFEVGGFPLHAADSEAARRFLGAFAGAINALPAEAAFLVRSRPGGLGDPIRQAAARSEALVAAGEAGLAEIAADQAAHYRRLEAEGKARETVCYLAVRGTDAAALGETARKATGHFAAAGLRVTPLKGGRMVRAVAESWRPGAVEQCFWRPHGPHLVFRQIGHRALVEDRRPRAKVQPETAGDGKALPGGSR
jgi:hypothetical protein